MLGMEVIYTGLHQTPENIVNIAIQEDANAIGLSVLSGAHNHHFTAILDLLKAKGINNILIFGGGVIPEDDAIELARKGVGKIFGPGTPLDEVINYVKSNVKW